MTDPIAGSQEAPFEFGWQGMLMAGYAATDDPVIDDHPEDPSEDDTEPIVTELPADVPNGDVGATEPKED